MGKSSLVLLVGLVGCEAQVFENDGSAGTSQGGASTSTTNTTSSSSGASSGNGGGSAGAGPVLFDAQTACEETCHRPCVGGPQTCMLDCLDVIEPNCEREAFEFFECTQWYCDPVCDLDALESALLACLNPFYCGHGGNELVCDWDTESICDCTGHCEEGHVGRIVCPEDEGPCECWFDGELVATCTHDDPYSTGCDYQSSCCAGYMLPGGGPAAGEL